MQAIDASLKACEAQMRGLEARGRTNLPVFATLRDRYRQLKQRRTELNQESTRIKGEGVVVGV